MGLFGAFWGLEKGIDLENDHYQENIQNFRTPKIPEFRKSPMKMGFYGGFRSPTSPECNQKLSKGPYENGAF